ASTWGARRSRARRWGRERSSRSSSTAAPATPAAARSWAASAACSSTRSAWRYRATARSWTPSRQRNDAAGCPAGHRTRDTGHPALLRRLPGLEELIRFRGEALVARAPVEIVARLLAGEPLVHRQRLLEG